MLYIRADVAGASLCWASSVAMAHKSSGGSMRSATWRFLFTDYGGLIWFEGLLSKLSRQSASYRKQGTVKRDEGLLRISRSNEEKREQNFCRRVLGCATMVLRFSHQKIWLCWPFGGTLNWRNVKTKDAWESICGLRGLSRTSGGKNCNFRNVSRNRAGLINSRHSRNQAHNIRA